MSDPADIEKILGILQGTSIRHFELQNRLAAISLRREPTAPPLAPEEPARDAAGEEKPADSASEIIADRVGVFRRAAEAGAPPLVKEGDAVESGQVVGFVHALGQPYELVARRDGKVAEILLEDDHPVQYGQPVIRLEG